LSNVIFYMVGITGPFAVDLGKPKEELKIKKIYI
jgi:hypothetical protein